MSMVDLVDFWPVLLFWPAVALSVLAASFGLARRRPMPLLVAAALVGPASAYLAMTPRFFVWGAVSGRRVSRGRGRDPTEPQRVGRGTGCSECRVLWLAGCQDIRLSPVRMRISHPREWRPRHEH